MRDCIFNFPEDPMIPSDNNGSERDATQAFWGVEDLSCQYR